jgi:uncharacterized protein
MKVIAIEEHFTIQAIAEANSARRTATGTGAVPPPGRMASQVSRLQDLGAGRLADMDASGITMQVLSHVGPATQALDAASAVPLAREANDALAQAVAAHPDRFAGFATLPTPDPRAAAAELERAVTSLGFKGALINGHTQGRFLDDQAFWPILEAAESLGVAIYLHPTEPVAAVRDAYYAGFDPAVSQLLATSGWGWHIETGLHSLRLILAGIFDRFPRLQIIIGHMGEALPFMLARTNTVLNQSVTHLQRSVEDYFLAHFSITTSGFFTNPPLLCTLPVVGAGRILFAVDYPFSTNDEGRRFLDAAPLSQEDKERIAHGNAERLLRL